jgi:hypothetical protein
MIRTGEVLIRKRDKAWCVAVAYDAADDTVTVAGSTTWEKRTGFARAFRTYGGWREVESYG